jgi:acyl-coenzyme A thioesterase PaaI-like protein
VTTAELHVSFERPGSAGCLRGQARVESSDEHPISSTGELVKEQGKVFFNDTATTEIYTTGNER